jgi:hypothetical protein
VVGAPVILALFLILLATGAARAEDEEYGSTFGRLRYVDGAFSLQRTKEGDVTEAAVNSPVAPGDRAWTEDGRAEIALADGSIIWLDRDTRLDLRSLADINNRFEKTNLLALLGGTVRIEAPETDDKDKVFQIDTEAGSVYLLSAGTFRIDAESGLTTVSSFSGVAEISGDEGSVLVRSGERTSVRTGRAASDPRPFNTLRRDDFDQFCEERAEAYLRHEGTAPIDRIEQEVPREVHPYVGELSAYGNWSYLPPYGWVWRPVYAADWGPYYSGHWAWYPTGWVWVSYDPWGWAPYHYGRWDFSVGVGWIWIPGSRWSGAWVSWAVGPSYIGWCPLNYYNRPIFQNVQVINVVNVNVNRLDGRGWRFVPAGRFTDRRVERALVRPDRLPRGTDVVVTGRLPRFEPREVAERPERGRALVEKARATRAPVPSGEPGRAVPFRNMERSEGRRRAPATVAPRTDPRLRPRNEPRGPNVEPRGPNVRSTPQRGGVDPRSAPGRGPARGRTMEPRREAPRPEGRQPERQQPQGRQPERQQFERQQLDRQGPRPQTRQPQRQDVRPGARPPVPQGQPPQVRQPDPRQGHVVERIFEGVRRDSGGTRVAPPRESPRQQAPPPDRKPQGEDRGSRPPRKEKDKDR